MAPHEKGSKRKHLRLALRLLSECGLNITANNVGGGFVLAPRRSAPHLRQAVAKTLRKLDATKRAEVIDD